MSGWSKVTAQNYRELRKHPGHGVVAINEKREQLQGSQTGGPHTEDISPSPRPRLLRAVTLETSQGRAKSFKYRRDFLSLVDRASPAS